MSLLLFQSSVCSDESVCTVSSEMSTSAPDPALRGKLRLMKKKVQDLEKLLAEHSEQVKVRQQEVAAKEKVIGERDEVIESLTRQLQVQIQAMDEMGPTRPQEGATVPTGVSNIVIYLSILYFLFYSLSLVIIV